MATRIKRYEERLDRLDQLLARIEDEMGPLAQLETREFHRGRILGLFGGLRMIEIVATTEVELNNRPPGRNSEPALKEAPLVSGGLSEKGEPLVREFEQKHPQTSADDTGLTAFAQAVDNGQRNIDLHADAPVDLPFVSEGEVEKQQLGTQKSPPQIAAIVSLADGASVFEAGQGPGLGAPNPGTIPGEVAAPAKGEEKTLLSAASAQVQPELGPSMGVAETKPAHLASPTTSNDDLAEIKDTISELKQTIGLLVAQSQASQQNPPPESSVDVGHPGAVTQQLVNPLAIDPGTMFSGIQRNVFDLLLDWNIGPYDAIDLINTALNAYEDPAQLNKESLAQVVIRDICRNVLLSGGIKLSPAPPGKVVALVGATGVGKSTTIAKLAARFTFQGGKRVSLVSLDNYRIAAVEQLRTYTDIMGIDLDIVFSGDEFDQILTERAHNDLTLIDTAGRSPLNTKQIFELRDIFSAHPPDEVHLVVSASTKGDDLRTILENFEPLSYDHVIVSKLDETRSLGCVYNINKLCRMPISYFTVGQSVPEDIRTATLSFIQSWIDKGRII